MESVNRLLVREADQLILLLTPPFDKTAHDPATSRAIRRACAKTAGSTPMPPSGQPGLLPELGQGERAGGLFRLLNPVNHADTPEKMRLYMVEPYGIAADIYSQPPQPESAAGPGTPVQPAGCTGWGSKPSWASPGWVRRSRSTPASPGIGRDLKWITALEPAITRSAWRTRRASIAASADSAGWKSDGRQPDPLGGGWPSRHDCAWSSWDEYYCLSTMESNMN